MSAPASDARLIRRARILILIVVAVGVLIALFGFLYALSFGTGVMGVFVILVGVIMEFALTLRRIGS